MSVAGEIPKQVRLRLGHAAVQVVADRVGADVLHIKGEALDPEIRWDGRSSSDVDVLVRPKDVTTLVRALVEAGWTRVSGFAASSAFEHSATLAHPFWGYADVHRHYPGFTVPDADAFEQLWRSRRDWRCAGMSCAVPELTGQRLVLLLHAARSVGSARGRADVAQVWTDASPEVRREVTELADRFGARVALAAATGALDEWADDPEHDLWQVVSAGGTRVDEWRARVRAARTLRAKARLVLRAPLVNVEHLTMIRGSRPTRREIIVEFFARPARGVREELARRRAR